MSNVENSASDPVTDSIFGKIARKEIPVDAVYEDDFVIAFRDMSPQAPVHILVIPKKPVENALALTDADREMAGAVLVAAAEVARRLGVAESGIRIVLNLSLIHI